MTQINLKDIISNNSEDIGVIDNKGNVSYKELQIRVDQIVSELKRKGVNAGDVVGILLPRDRDMVASTLAVWKIGAAVLPLDMKYPKDRIIYMLKQSEPKVIICLNEHLYDFLADFTRNEGKLIKTKSRLPLDFSTLPIPNRTYIEHSKYTLWTKMAISRDVVTMQLTRGCPYHCLYCHKIWTKKHSARTAEQMFEEVNLFYKAGVRKFSIVDDIFNWDIDNSKRFFEMIIKNKLDIQLFFGNGIRGDILSKDYIDIMVEAGLVHLAFALETASPRLQKLIRKNINIEKLHSNMEYIIQNHKHVLLDIYTMLGFPTETQAEALMTLDFIKSLKWLHNPFIFILKIYPNTDMYDFAIENGVRKEDIMASLDLAYHEIPKTLPFSEHFVKEYQADFLNNYFLNKERLLNILPKQINVLSERNFLQNYNIYLPKEFNSFNELIDFFGITEKELGKIEFQKEDHEVWDNLNKNIACYFPKKELEINATRVLLIDVSQEFSNDSYRHHNAIEPPLGLMYIMTYLDEHLGSRINGKIIKSRIDFDSYSELEVMLDDFKPDIIGMRALSHNKILFHRVGAVIREFGFYGPLICGGPYPTSSYEELLSDGNVDLAVIGEGEETFLQLVQEFIKNKNKLPDYEVLKNIPGIAFRMKNKGIRKMQPLIIDKQFKTDPLESIDFSDKELAYIVFTSGSTGNPKGVMIERKSINNLLEAWDDYYGLLGKPKNVLQLASFSFDAWIGDALKAFSSCGSLVICEENDKFDLLKICQLIQKHKVSLIELTPSYILMLMEFSIERGFDLSSLEIVIIGGESCTTKEYGLLKDFSKKFGFRLVNGYGVTEACIETIVYEGEAVYDSVVPIGKPLKGMKVWVAKNGELYIGGQGLGRGYLKNDILTRERFVELSGQGMFYKTGDLVKYNEVGDLLYLGREDNQVEINGKRVELLEIENVIEKINGVTKAKVINYINQKGKVFIVAFYLSEILVGQQKIKEELKLKLPDFLLPHKIILLQEFPLNVNGKIDKKLLIEIAQKDNNKFLYEPPRNELERDILMIFQNVLGIKRLSILDDIFELGVDSLDVIKIISRLNVAGYKCNLSDIYFYRSIKNLTILFEGKKNEGKITDMSIAEKLLLDRFRVSFNYSNQFIDILNRKVLVLIVDKEIIEENCVWDFIIKEFSLELIPEVIGTRERVDYYTSSKIDYDDFFKQLFKEVRLQETNFFNSILNGNLKEVRSLFFSSDFSKYYSGRYFIVNIPFEMNENISIINNILVEMLKQQEILRSFLYKKDDQLVIKVKEWSDDLTIENIPFIDLSKKPFVVSDIFYMAALEYLKIKDKFLNFPFRILLLKKTETKFELFFSLAEWIHDDPSEIIVRNYFSNLSFKLNNGIPSFVPRGSFIDYLALMEKVGIKIPDKKIIEEFNLNDFLLATNELKSYVGEERNVHSYQIDINGNNEALEVSMGLNILLAFVKTFTSLKRIPISYIHDARLQYNRDYLGSIGEFSEYVPYVLDISMDDPIVCCNDLKSKIKLIQEYQINFFALVKSNYGDASFPCTKNILKECVGDVMSSNAIFLYQYLAYENNQHSYELKLDKDKYKDTIPVWPNGFRFTVVNDGVKNKLLLNTPYRLPEDKLEEFKRIISV